MGQFSNVQLAIDKVHTPGLGGLNQVYGTNRPTLSD